MTGVYVLLLVLGAATVFGLWRRHTDGRMRTVVAAPAPAGGGVGGPADGSARAEGIGGASDGSADGSADGAVPAQASAADDSEPLMVDGHPIEVVDHTLVPAADVLGPADLGQSLGERATLLQFSSAFCTPCRATRVVLGDVAGMIPGVVHIEVDAESHLDLVRQLDVTRTPTVLVLDSTGRIRTRATGAPRKADVIAALGEVV
jgi:thiol-disulfide isomerase/thioredoxin